MSAVEDWAWAQDLGNSKIVLICLAKHADWDTLECYPSQKRLGAMCGKSERFIRDALKELEELGHIRRTKRMDQGLPDIIRLNSLLILPPPAESVRNPRQTTSRPPARAADKPSIEPSDRTSALKRESNLFGAETESATPPPSNEPPAGAFELFWREYPRKTAIGAARAAFVKAWPKIPDPQIDPRSPIQPAPGFEKCVTLMRAIDAQKPGWTDPKFIPHASTWLNQERWADEVQPNKTDVSRRFGTADWN